VENGRRVAREIGAAATFAEVDVAVSDSVKGMVDAALSAFGGLDIVVSNAGMVHPAMPTDELPEEIYERVMAVNVKSVYLAVRHAVPVMVARGGGVMINTASTASLKPRPGNVVYGMSKAAVVGFTKGLAAELAPRKIRVNALLPCAAMTPVLMDFIGHDNQAAADEIASRIPLGRLCGVEDMAAAATFLASDEAAFLSGVALPVDGAWTTV
jgi:3-oxoacyl-[acyl-carrier protein] reductase